MTIYDCVNLCNILTHTHIQNFFDCQTALRKIAAEVNNVHVEEEIVTLWLEYENSSSSEAVLAHQLDKLEMIMQANEYEEQQNIDLDDFFQSTRDSFSHPEVRNYYLMFLIIILDSNFLY